MVFLYTGSGKGKTTAAVGQAVRACGRGWRVCMLQFMKGRDYGENLAAASIPLFEIIKCGRDEFVNPQDPEKIDIELARQGLERAEKAILSGDYSMVILDEINVALDFGLFSLQKVKELILNRPEEVYVILTGRYAAKELIEIADTVSEINEIKHHYNSGIKAVEGIEY